MDANGNGIRDDVELAIFKVSQLGEDEGGSFAICAGVADGSRATDCE